MTRLPSILGLSLLEPWASLMAHGHKRVETRSWKTPYRGLVAIQASKSRQAVKDGTSHHLWWDVLGREEPEYHFGCIIAVVRLLGCVETEAISPTLDSQEQAFGNYEPGRFAWRFEAVPTRLVRPVLCKGMLGLWMLQPAADSDVRVQSGTESLA
jgi:hypothetical protein